MQLLANFLITLFSANCVLLAWRLGLSGWPAFLFYVVAAAALAVTHVWPAEGKFPSKRLKVLRGGGSLLLAYLATLPLSMCLAVWAGVRMVPHSMRTGVFVAHCLVVLAVTGAAFLSGGLRVFGTSVQLGVKWRVALLLLWWMPLVGYFLAWKACRVAWSEYRFETAKCALDQARAENELCRTRYPILLVHGVFFRDSQFLNYWGRIPGELIRNGAQVYYGNQQSAASVADSGRELAARIREIVEETGCGKVNMIAHSKGGLDARFAISCLGTAPMVASLTTINTPHRGCVFAERLLELAPAGFQEKLARTYNGALRRLGDQNPDFLAAVRDLTASACARLNERAPDSSKVLYESVGSYVRRAQGGRFPLNVSYRLVKRFDGQNDGLVSVESAEWGSRFTLLEPSGRRGITHADVIDLGRENIRGFDVREFYVNLVQRLKERGY